MRRAKPWFSALFFVCLSFAAVETLTPSPEVLAGEARKGFASQADEPVAASFDNFTINSAQEIEKEARFSHPAASTGCDLAPSLFWKGKFASNKEDAYRYYMEAIELCPGFIRPYELIGNYFRKKGKNSEAIEFFTQAADLGSVNYKLHYLLASLFFKEGDFDAASRYLNRSLHIRGDYQKSLRLKSRIEKEGDTGGPKIILHEPSEPFSIEQFCPGPCGLTVASPFVVGRGNCGPGGK